jgi:SAM-dependent methyltransferase
MTYQADQIVGLYRRHAHTFARQRGTDLLEKVWLDRFCDLMPANPNVLDIGCGTGEPIARYLAARGSSVTGVDSSPELMGLFKANLPGHPTQVVDMRVLSLGTRFHGILAWNSFFHLSHDHQRRMFPIFREHASPHAALMFTTGSSHGEAIGTFEGEPLYHASLDTEEYRELLDRNGFDMIRHVVDDSKCGGLTIWLTQLRDES